MPPPQKNPKPKPRTSYILTEAVYKSITQAVHSHFVPYLSDSVDGDVQLPLIQMTLSLLKWQVFTSFVSQSNFTLGFSHSQWKKEAPLKVEPSNLP